MSKIKAILELATRLDESTLNDLDDEIEKEIQNLLGELADLLPGIPKLSDKRLLQETAMRLLAEHHDIACQVPYWEWCWERARLFVATQPQPDTASEPALRREMDDE